jgi:hypothetical protein
MDGLKQQEETDNLCPREAPEKKVCVDFFFSLLSCEIRGAGELSFETVICSSEHICCKTGSFFYAPVVECMTIFFFFFFFFSFSPHLRLVLDSGLKESQIRHIEAGLGIITPLSLSLTVSFITKRPLNNDQ